MGSGHSTDTETHGWDSKSDGDALSGDNGHSEDVDRLSDTDGWHLCEETVEEAERSDDPDVKIGLLVVPDSVLSA